MSLPRFFAPDLPRAGTFDLDEDQSRHLSQVLRLSPGQEVVAFDGNGGEALCVIETCTRKSARLAIARRTDTDRELNCRLHLFVALPKGDRQKNLVESLVQLGVSGLHPLITQRSVAEPVDSALERLERQVIEASKQCGRNTLMRIGAPQALRAGNAMLEMNSIGTLKYVAHPYHHDQPLAATAGGWDSAKEIWGLIGPEGGLTEQEVQLLSSQGWQPVHLGTRILRVELAAIAMASVIGLRVANASGNN